MEVSRKQKEEHVKKYVAIYAEQLNDEELEAVFSVLSILCPLKEGEQE